MDFRHLIDIVNGQQTQIINENLFEYDCEDEGTLRILELAGITPQQLLENRIQWLRDNIFHKVEQFANDLGKDPEELFQWIVDQDPDPKKRHTQWMFKILLGKNGSATLEDLERAPGVLKKYEEMKRNKKLDPKYNDLNQFISLTALENTLKSAEESEEAEDIQEFTRAVNQSEVIQQDDTYMIVRPETKWAAQYWGRPSLWCTATGCPKGRQPDKTNNLFDQYYGKGSLYILYNKKDPRKSYQLFTAKDAFSTVDGESYEIRDADNNNVPDSVVQKISSKYPVIDKLITQAKEVGTVEIFGEEYEINDLYDLAEEIIAEYGENDNEEFYDDLLEEGTLTKYVLTQAAFDTVQFKKFIRLSPINKNNYQNWEEVILNAAPENAEAAGVFANLFMDGKWDEYEVRLWDSNLPEDVQEMAIRDYMRGAEPDHWKSKYDQIIKMGPNTLLHYVKYVEPGRDPKIEERLEEYGQIPYILMYMKVVGMKDRWPEIEPYFMTDRMSMTWGSEYEKLTGHRLG